MLGFVKPTVCAGLTDDFPSGDSAIFECRSVFDGRSINTSLISLFLLRSLPDESERTLRRKDANRKNLPDFSFFHGHEEIG